jgi:hypothetical protein
MLKWGKYVVLEVGRELILLADNFIESLIAICIYFRDIKSVRTQG